MKKLNRAVITGASSGIGEAFANLLASQGVNLVIAARRTDRLNQLAQDLQQKHRISVEVISIDLSEEGAAEQLFQFATQNGEVDLLINNAGIGPYRHFLKTKLVDHRSVIQLNMISLTNLCHLFASHMLKVGKDASILNVASVASYTPVPRYAVYCASKSYVRVFSEILNYELKNTCVSVSTLCPGGTRTEFLDKNNQISKDGGRFLMGPEKVALIGLKGTMAKKSVIIPGLFNKLSCFLPRFLPEKILLLLSEKILTMAVKEQN